MPLNPDDIVVDLPNLTVKVVNRYTNEITQEIKVDSRERIIEIIDELLFSNK
jgi:hypothetical protein